MRRRAGSRRRAAPCRRASRWTRPCARPRPRRADRRSRGRAASGGRTPPRARSARARAGAPARFVSPDGRAVVFVRSTKKEQTIVVRRNGSERPVFRVSELYHVVNDEQGPIWLLGWSPDSRWLLYTIDPDGSGSIAADGLSVRIVRSAGGPPRTIARMRVYPDSCTWCGSRRVLTAGRGPAA